MCGRCRQSQSSLINRGAALFLAAILMIVMLAFAAIVIDLSATRSDRASNQSMSDSAAAAGAMELNDNGGESACLTAISYFEEMSGETVGGHNCGTLPTTCTSPHSVENNNRHRGPVYDCGHLPCR